MKWVKALLLVLFIAAAFADVITTHLAVSQHEAIAARESNPLVVNFGIPLWALYIFKMLMIGLVAYLFYKPVQPSERTYYYWVLFVFYMTIVQFAVAGTNYHIYENAEHYIDAPALTQKEMNDAYSSLIINKVFLPILMAITPFLIWEWSVKKNKYQKRRLLGGQWQHGS